MKTDKLGNTYFFPCCGESRPEGRAIASYCKKHLEERLILERKSSSSTTELIERKVEELRTFLEKEGLLNKEGSLAMAEHIFRTFAAKIASLAHQEGRKERDREYTAIFAWLLGEEGDFPARAVGDGAYYWRRTLRKKLEAITPSTPHHE